LWAFGDDRIRAAVLVALDAGVEAALGCLERHAAVGTVGGRTQPGLGLAAPGYRHEVSRADEAHLHAHVVIANEVPIPLLDEDGRPVLDADGVALVVWRTLDSEALLACVQAAGYLGAAALRHELSRQLGVAWGPVRNGVAEIAGFPRELLDAFSSRGHQVSSSTRSSSQPAETITRIAERFLAEPRAAAAAWAAAGRTVVGTANGGRQAEELGERLEVRTRVVAAWLTLLDHSPDPAEVWAPGTVVVLDEATQVSTRNAERLLRHATRAGAVLVPVGDPAQLGSVGAGGWFAHLVATKPRVPELTANQRQRGRAWRRCALRSPACAAACPPTRAPRWTGWPPTAAWSCASPASSCWRPWSVTGTPNTAPTANGTPQRSAPGR
jgi:hypothetical protein